MENLTLSGPISGERPDEHKQVEAHTLWGPLNDNRRSGSPRRGSDALPARSGFSFLSG